MKFYLASDFNNVKEVERVATLLQRKGHKITCEWWHFDSKKAFKKDSDPIFYMMQSVRALYLRNLDAIREADAFILVCPMDKAVKFNGANIELGFALALGKPCFSLGLLQRSAMYVPVHKVMYLDHLLHKAKELLGAGKAG